MMLHLARNLRRNTHFYAILVFSILNAGCIHSRHIHHDSPQKELNTINEELAGKTAQITFHSDPGELTAENIRVSPDSVFFVDTKTDRQQRFANTDIDKIIVRNHSRGALEGFGGGLLTWGGLVGLVAIVIGGNDDSDEDGPTGGQAVAYAFVAGTLLPITGTIVGAAAGSRKIYNFNQK